jgi:hypothetical protein
MEVESDLISPPDDLKTRILRLFQLANEAVVEELNEAPRYSDHVDNQIPPGFSGSSTGDLGNGNGSVTGNGNGQTNQRPPRPATASQLRAIRAIAGKHRLDLPGILRQRFYVDSEEQLSISLASQLIDYLKAEVGEATR